MFNSLSPNTGRSGAKTSKEDPEKDSTMPTPAPARQKLRQYIFPDPSPLRVISPTMSEEPTWDSGK
ncbi:hypothetical protein K438DRAFT_1827052 [Mycena galopus ATCC 62051]|nr:hypothetical protein K438DRAFT_1827052 [Mycena galopus ATCC 62051]